MIISQNTTIQKFSIFQSLWVLLKKINIINKSQYDHTVKLLTKNKVLQMNSRSPVLKCLPYKKKKKKKLQVKSPLPQFKN